MFISTILVAQKPNYKFKTISQHDGLINSTVQSIFEDSFGFIWLGTHHGVQRYDGKVYRNYEHTEYDSTSLSQNYVNAFCEDNIGNIWIATGGGLNKYNRKTDRVKKYVWRNKSSFENREPFITGLSSGESNGNTIWLNVLEGGLFKLDIQTDSLIAYPSGSEDEKLFSWILPVPGKKNKLLMGGAKLFLFDKVLGEFEEILALDQNNELPNNLINDAVFDPTDNDIIWLATGDIWGRGSLGGLIQYNIKTGLKTTFSNKTRKDEVPDVHILQVGFYDVDNLWVGTRNNGALLYKKGENRFYNYQRNEYDEGSFVTQNAVRSMLLDRSGTLWFGTWGDGISLLTPSAQKFSHYKHLPGNKGGVPDNNITAITEDKDNNIWIGTKEGGLTKFNPRNNTFENFYPEFVSNSIEITHMLYDSRQNLWIGTYDDALHRFRPETGQKVHYKKGISNQHVTQKRISAISEIKPGEILISTYGGGLNIYDYPVNRFRHFMHDTDDSTSIPDNQVWLPFLGDDGNYYLSGNSFTSLIRFNPKTEEFNTFPNMVNVSTFIATTKTPNGRIYIDDVAEGLREIKIGNKVSVETIYDVNGQSIKNVETMLCDGEDKLWLSTGNGLLKFDPELRSVVRYNVDDGLQGYAFNRLSGFKSSTGEMYFGGTNGFNVFHPDEIKLSYYKPPIVFTEFKLYQENVTIGGNSPLKQNILLMDELVLDYNQNDFSISFAALDFSNPDNIEYKYILENHDNDWINAGYSNVASYTNMDPGDYVFKVLATNADGVWNDESKSIKITIHPPLWQTTLAYIIYALIFILGIIIIDRYQRKRFKEKTRAKAREKELEQAKAIEKAYTKLKTTQTQLIHSEKMASLGELTAGIAHEIQNPLNFVNNFSDVSVDLVEELNEELSEGNTEEVKSISQDLKQNLEKIHHHGERASSIVKGMLEHSRAGDGKKEPTDLNAMADEYIRLAYHGIRAKNKSFNADFKTDLDNSLPLINVVGQDIARVVLNLINNAFFAVAEKSKNEPKGYKPFVSISTLQKDNTVIIKVSDNGSGIPSNILDKIFQPFFTTKQSGEGTGLGLSLSYDIITKGHGGVLKVETKEDSGSEFIIVLPINIRKA